MRHVDVWHHQIRHERIHWNACSSFWAHNHDYVALLASQWMVAGTGALLLPVCLQSVGGVRVASSSQPDQRCKLPWRPGELHIAYTFEGE